jgi:hypothetical protein
MLRKIYIGITVLPLLFFGFSSLASAQAFEANAKLTATTDIKPADFVAAAVAVLQDDAYTVETMNADVGVVTTGWKTIGGVTRLVSGGEQNRMMLTLRPDKRTISGQLTRRRDNPSNRSANESAIMVTGGDRKHIQQVVADVMKMLRVEVLKEDSLKGGK